LQQPRWAAGICIEANASSDKAQEASPEKDVDMVNHNQPQGEGDEPDYEEYLLDIPHE
jgi:hypothetical protein